MTSDGVTLSSLLLTRKSSWALRGAEEEKTDPKGDPEDGKKDPEDDKSKDPEKKDKKDAPETVTLTGADAKVWSNFTEERERIHQKRRDAEKERDEAKEALATLQASGATDKDAQKQLGTLTSERDALAVENKALKIKNSFLETPGYEWQNAGTAFRLLDTDKVELDAKGNVIASSLKSAMDALAKDNEFLLKPKEEPEDPDKVEKKDTPRKTGQPAPSAKKTGSDKDQAAREQALRDKYPALRKR